MSSCLWNEECRLNRLRQPTVPFVSKLLIYVYSFLITYSSLESRNRNISVETLEFDQSELTYWIVNTECPVPTHIHYSSWKLLVPNLSKSSYPAFQHVQSGDLHSCLSAMRNSGGQKECFSNQRTNVRFNIFICTEALFNRLNRKI